MDKREKIIRLWFDMWLQKKDLGIEDIFSADALYIESWGPQYQGVAMVKHWFEEWNTRNRSPMGHQAVFPQRGSDHR